MAPAVSGCVTVQSITGLQAGPGSPRAEAGGGGGAPVAVALFNAVFPQPV